MTRRRTILFKDEADARLVKRAEAEGLPPGLWIRHLVCKALVAGSKRGAGRPKAETPDARELILDCLSAGPYAYEDVIKMVGTDRHATVLAINELRSAGRIEGTDVLRLTEGA